MDDASPAKIVGIVLVRNEDIFVERAICNAIDFCDALIVADHLSTDQTPAIVQRLAEKYPEKIRVTRINEARESHFLISGYANSRTWIFAVDGDELYDPNGLSVMRRELLAGKYDRWWLLFGNVLNCTEIDEAKGTATGYLSPP